MLIKLLVREYNADGIPIREFIEPVVITDDNGCYYYADGEELVLTPSARAILDAAFRRFPAGPADPYNVEIKSVDGCSQQYC